MSKKEKLKQTKQEEKAQEDKEKAKAKKEKFVEKAKEKRNKEKLEKREELAKNEKEQEGYSFYAKASPDNAVKNTSTGKVKSEKISFDEPDSNKPEPSINSDPILNKAPPSGASLYTRKLPKTDESHDG